MVLVAGTEVHAGTLAGRLVLQYKKIKTVCFGSNNLTSEASSVYLYTPFTSSFGIMK